MKSIIKYIKQRIKIELMPAIVIGIALGYKEDCVDMKNRQHNSLYIAILFVIVELRYYKKERINTYK